MDKRLVWFRQDLRVTANPALEAALATAAHVSAIFIATPMQWKEHHVSERQIRFLKDATFSLGVQLAHRHIRLEVVVLEYFREIPNYLKTYCAQHRLSSIYYNRHHAWNERQCELKVRQALPSHVQMHAFDGDTFLSLAKPIMNGSNLPFQKFSSFQEALLKFLERQNWDIPPINLCAYTPSNCLLSPSLRQFVQFDPKGCAENTPTVEYAAHQQWRKFLDRKIDHYARTRDFFYQTGSSQLSVYLATGVLGVRSLLHDLLLHDPLLLEKNRSSGTFCWLSELIWREFFRYLMVCYPHLSKGWAFHPFAKKLRWRANRRHWYAWVYGLTGYPLVDAAMRCLRTTGWLHNRLRMVVASFLTKDLLIHWKKGENYFLSQLVDGDFASNNGGWQWCASIGVDAQPYFRIFNPVLQAKRYDPHAKFIKQWVPELRKLPLPAIFEPHKWTNRIQAPLNYPNPIVVHAAARAEALAEFKRAKATEQRND